MVVPPRSECMSLIKRFYMPRHVLHHTIAVKTLALAIGSRLNAHGVDIDMAKLESAALLHDLFKVKDFIDSQDGSLNAYPEEAWKAWRSLKKEYAEPHSEAIVRFLTPNIMR